MKKRYFGLDFIRAIAAFFVIAVHYFLNTDFYQLPIRGKMLFFITIFRWIFFIAVPLFLLLTGYLQCHKKLDKKYYKGIIRILVSYFFISVITLLFRRYYLHQTGSRLQAIINIFSFRIISISWYIEMYIGLFLLVPFLNILYNGLDTKKKKQWLIITLLCLVSISPVINPLKIRGINLEIIPDWWNYLYPLLYYFIGCYIREYSISISKTKGTLVFIGIILLETIISYLYCYNGYFTWNILGDYNSITCIISATIFFLLLYKMECKKKYISSFIELLSIVSLDIYLFSWISDILVYANFTTIRKEYMYFPIYVLASFIIAFLLSLVKKLLFDIISKIYYQFKTKKV